MKKRIFLIVFMAATVFLSSDRLLPGFNANKKEASAVAPPEMRQVNETSAIQAESIMPVEEVHAVETGASNSAKIPTVDAAVTPRKIRIPAISVDASILAMGVTSSGILDTPDNFVDAGWYKDGTIPGQTGSAVIDAHVDNGGTIPGPFKRLKELGSGDRVEITMSDGTVQNFRVTGRGIYNYKTVDTYSLFHQNDGKYVKLITCHGNWLSGEKTYDQRLVVTATLASM